MMNAFNKQRKKNIIINTMTFYTMDKNEPNTIVAKSLEKLLK